MRLVLSVILALAAGNTAYALTVSARVNKNRAALNDQILLTVSISLDEASWPQPQMPSVPNFNIHSAGRRNRTNIINNRMTSTVEHDYVLVPRFVGNAVIPPITVSHNGQTVRTPPINIRILPADTATPQPPPQTQSDAPRDSESSDTSTSGPDMFITAEVDNKAPFVNEQILLSVRFYLGVPTLGDAEYEFPDTHGFTRENMGTANPTNVNVKGRPYVLHEIKTALFPIKADKLTIGPTKITAKIRDRIDMNTEGPDFFRMFFSQPLVTIKPKTITSKPITIAARNLPERGKPKGFDGAVGRYKIRATVDPISAKVGEAVTLTLVVHGRGNIKTMGDVGLPDMKEFRVYETVTSLDVKTDDKGVNGTKTFKTVLVPRVSGTLRIPPIPFSFFDPALREYVSLQTQSIDIPVAPGDAAAAPVGFQATGNGTAITRVATDIRHIKRTVSVSLFRSFTAAFANAVWIHLIPSFVFLAGAGFVNYKTRLLSDPVKRRFREALPAAKSRIEESRRSQEPAALLADALANYIADKLNVPAAGLTLKDAVLRLKLKNPLMDETLLKTLKTLWENFEMLRFAPKATGEADDALAENLLSLLKQLERVIRP